MANDLVERAQRGDHDAFEVLARGSIDRLYAMAERVLRDPSAAEDAVQDCLIRVWRDLRALRNPAQFEAWTYRLLLNACRDEQRRIRRRPVQVEISPRDRTTEQDTPTEVAHRDQIERGFKALTVEHRMVLALHHYLGLRPREIAELLGIPEGTATSRIHYGTRALRAALESDLVLQSAGRRAAP